jgi:hypothetical protein
MKLCEVQMSLNLHDFDLCQIKVNTVLCDFEFEFDFYCKEKSKMELFV